jgi:hypothetical protein
MGWIEVLIGGLGGPKLTDLVHSSVDVAPLEGHSRDVPPIDDLPPPRPTTEVAMSDITPRRSAAFRFASANADAINRSTGRAFTVPIELFAAFVSLILVNRFLKRAFLSLLCT